MEALVFSAYPIGKHHVQVVHNFDKLGLAKLVVVIVPASHLALNLYCYLLEFPVKMGMQLPLLHLLMQLLHRFPADGRKKVCEALALPSIPWLAALESIAEKVKGSLRAYNLLSGWCGSKKVCNLLSENPPALVRWGTVIIVAIFLTLLLVVCFMPYPHSKGESILQHLLMWFPGNQRMYRL